MSKTTVVIVEDDPHARARLVDAVSAGAGANVVAAVGTLSEGLHELAAQSPDVLIVDLGLPDGSGIDLIRASRRLSADTLCLVMTVFGDEKTVLGAIEAGARGYLLKDASASRIAASLADLLAGGAPIDSAIARHLLLRFQSAPEPAAGVPVPSLSARETAVLELVVKGLTFGEIARVLDVQTTTVKTYIRRIYRKLEVRSRSEAVFEALQLGIIDLDDSNRSR